MVFINSFAKINLGLQIGPARPDGFHELRTVYQTVAMHDVIRVFVGRGSGIEIHCDDPRVPTGSTNTCYRIIERAMAALNAGGRIVVEIEKKLPVQGGLGGASGNAVAALLGLERALRKQLSAAERLRIAADVGSDIPLFLVGGTVLGLGRGEEVYPLPDLPAMPCVIALPDIAVSTPKAFADWDRLCGAGALARDPLPSCHSEPVSAAEESAGPNQMQVPRLRGSSASARSSSLGITTGKRVQELKKTAASDRMSLFSREISAWLSQASGVSARLKTGGRAESPLLDLVRTGIENDFEKVVFPQYPELREVKRVLERAGAIYASLSGSGSAIYGLFSSREKASAAAKKLHKLGTQAVLTSTLTRRQYWKKLPAASS
jgi:4-diphosphocytidyl-2-C-methyl-D-erythritol kinase